MLRSVACSKLNPELTKQNPTVVRLVAENQTRTSHLLANIRWNRAGLTASSND